MKTIRNSPWKPIPLLLLAGILAVPPSGLFAVAQDFDDDGSGQEMQPQGQPPPPPPPPVGDDFGEAPPPDVDYDAGEYSPPDDVGGDSPSYTPGSTGGTGGKSIRKKANELNAELPSPAANVPPGEELVSIDFPEPTNIQDIVKAVSAWAGKNFIWTRKVTGTKVAIISPKMVTKEEAYQAFLSALHVAGFTTVETGKVVKIIPLNVAPRSNLKTFYGASWAPMTDEMITQIIPLTFIPARDLAKQIKSNLRLTRNIWAFEATNSVIVTDTGHNVRKILELIRLLDVKSNQPQFTIEPIKNTDASDIAKKLQELFNIRGAGSSPYLQKVIVDQRSNSLLLVGPPKGLDDVVRVIRRLDKPLGDQGSQAQIHVRPLDYAEADKLAQTLQALTQSSNRTGTRLPIPRPTPVNAKIPGAAGTVATVVADLGDVKITADKATNSLIIRGSKAAYKELDNIIRALDKRRDQVYIEVDILDIDITNNFKLEMSALGGASTNNGKVILPFGWNAKTAGGFSLASSSSDGSAAQSLFGGLPSDAILGVLGGTPVTIGNIKLSPGAFIFALKTDGNSNVLQTPSVLVADNEEANFNASEREYYQTTTTNDTANRTDTKWESTDAVLEVKIKPQVSKADFVNLDVSVKAERFSNRNATNAPPNKNTRNTTTKVTLKDKQTIVLNGLVRDIETTVMSKVPLLGDLPILGWLFRNTSKQKNKSNLAIFITPYVVRGPTDLAGIYEKKVKERDEFLEAFYGDDFREKPVFQRMPGLAQGMVTDDGSKSSGDAAVDSEEGDESGSPEETEATSANLPSTEPDPVVIPSVDGGVGGSGGDFSGPSMDSPDMSTMPEPPPPPPDLEPQDEGGDY